MADKIEKLVERERQLEKEVAELKRKLRDGRRRSAGGGLDDMLARRARRPRRQGARRPAAAWATPATLREIAEKLRDKLGEAVVLVGAVGQGQGDARPDRVQGADRRYRAGDLIKGIAQIVGGSGGGRPDMAQAGGTEVDKLDEALESLYARLA